MAININLILQQQITSLHTENKQKKEKKARRSAVLGHDTILSVEEGQNRIQQLDRVVERGVEEQVESRTHQYILPRCSSCGTIGHKINRCPNRQLSN